MSAHKDMFGHEAFSLSAPTDSLRGPCVTLHQFAGPLQFFAMLTPTQARAVAADLLALADQAGAPQQEAA